MFPFFYKYRYNLFQFHTAGWSFRFLGQSASIDYLPKQFLLAYLKRQYGEKVRSEQFQKKEHEKRIVKIKISILFLEKQTYKEHYKQFVLKVCEKFVRS